MNSSAVREALVTEFLRDALAADAVPVPELDEKARAKGLLSERESITTAKVFKRAKKSLGITSRRIGFGAQSKWHWQMPPPEQQNESSVEARAPQLGGLIASFDVFHRFRVSSACGTSRQFGLQTLNGRFRGSPDFG